MNKIYSLLGIGLLSAATLSSCKEDVFIEGGDELQRGRITDLCGCCFYPGV